MPFIVRLSRSCPYCMKFHKHYTSSLAAPYSFRIKLNFDIDYFDLSEVDPREPLFYHSATNSAFIGIPEDEDLLKQFIQFLVYYDIDTSFDRMGFYPAPEVLGWIDKTIHKINKPTYDLLRAKYAEASAETKKTIYKSEARVLERLSILMENI